MNHIDESLLDRYILRPSGLDESVRRSVQVHLDTCSVCLQTAEFLRAFYAELAGLPAQRVARLEDLIQSVAPPAGVIPLHPFRYEPPAGEEASSGYTTVLAAMSEETVPQRFHTVTCLVSERDHTLVRIMHDREKDTFTLYVRSEDAGAHAHAIVTFPSLAMELVTDGEGQVAFTMPKDRGPGDWDSLHAVLRKSVTMFRQHTADLPAGVERSLESGHTVHLAVRSGVLTIRVQSPPDLQATRALVRGSEIADTLVLLQEGEGQCTPGRLPQEINVRLYC